MKPLPADKKEAAKGFSYLFFGLGLTLILSVVLMLLMAQKVNRAEVAIIEKQAVIDRLQEVFSTLKDAETGQRGYVMTQNPLYLEPYLEATRRIDQEIEKLSLNEITPGFLQKFRKVVADKLSELEATIRLTGEGRQPEALARVQTQEGKRLMDSIRQIIGEAVATKSGESQQLRRDAERWRRTQLILFAAIAALNLAALYAAYRRILRDLEQQAEISREMAAKEELLRVTLASIGDGVIVTDTETRITYLNAVGESLTGWSSAEAMGQPCATVFKIINETTREPVLSPVDKVLEHGTIIGLANHTLLIRPDGSELPIDDSGAPILDEKKVVRGVVLVFRDFTEHKASEHELRRAMEAAESANIAKDNFLATLSHELRTPLSPVQSALALWEHDISLPAQLRTDLEMMRRNVDLEARLIDDLLDLTRIVRGKLYLNCETANAKELVDAVATMYRSEIQGRGQELFLSMEAADPYIVVDSARLQQVLLNVLKNATKFTPPGGKIHVSLANETGDEGKVVAIKVEDNGIGMQPELLEKLFLPFEQGAEEIVRRYGGLGLGMSISKALIEAQGGKISAESAGPGQGSTFIIRLPGAPKPDPQVIPARPEPRSEQSGISILLVEDHEDTSRMLSRLLKRWGHEVEIAGNVADGLAAMEKGAFDLVLSDVGLPDGTGLDLIRQIRKTSQITAVALTGYGMEADIAACKEAGFNEHLTKPINFQRLELILKNGLSAKATE